MCLTRWRTRPGLCRFLSGCSLFSCPVKAHGLIWVVHTKCASSNTHCLTGYSGMGSSKVVQAQRQRRELEVGFLPPGRLLDSLDCGMRGTISFQYLWCVFHPSWSSKRRLGVYGVGNLAGAVPQAEELTSELKQHRSDHLSSIKNLQECAWYQQSTQGPGCSVALWLMCMCMPRIHTVLC